MADSTERRTRWWLAALILAAAGGWIAYLWIQESSRQSKVMATIGVSLLALVVLLLWLVLFSGMPWRRRGKATLGVLVVLAVLVASFEVRGFTGDMVPVVGLRFAAADEVSPATTLDRPIGIPADAPAPSWADSPQFLGPARDAQFPDVTLATDWEAAPPVEVWRRPIGPGASGFAVVGHVAVTQEQRGDAERTIALDPRNGALLWAHGHDARYDTLIAGVGPRATPTVADGRVFTLGSTGVLDALDLATGELAWERDTSAEHGATPLTWGVAASPLVAGDLVIVPVGGRGRMLVAYDAATGAPAWTAGDDGAGYASPRLLTLAGVPQVVAVNNTTVSGHDPGTGALLWEHAFGGENPNCSDPVQVADDELVVASGYGVGAKRLRVTPPPDGRDRWTTEELWASRFLKSKMSNFVVFDGRLYGLDDGILACVDAETGRRVWKDGRFGHGQLLRTRDHLLVLTEFGELSLVALDPAGLRVEATLPVFDGKVWNQPALATPYLFVRDEAEAVCLELPLARPAR